MNQEIIHKIRWLQQAEGHQPCFRSGNIICKYENKCCWKELCRQSNIKIHQFEVKNGN